jgi:flagellar hook-length control protein FliK
VNTSSTQTAQARPQDAPAVAPSGGGSHPSLPTGGTAAQDGGQDARGRSQSSSTAQAASASSSHTAGASAAATASSTESVADLFAPGEAGDASATSQESLPGASGVDLQQMIESVRATIELASRQGVTQARIALQPEELGDIRIHLSQTADGLLARVTADTPAAAAALADGRAELHQSLSSLGVSLLRLDIGSSAQQQAGNGEARFAGGSETSGGARQSTAAEEDETSQTVGEPEDVGAQAGSQSGGLVDVLA